MPLNLLRATIDWSQPDGCNWDHCERFVALRLKNKKRLAEKCGHCRRSIESRWAEGAIRAGLEKVVSSWDVNQGKNRKRRSIRRVFCNATHRKDAKRVHLNNVLQAFIIPRIQKKQTSYARMVKPNQNLNRMIKKSMIYVYKIQLLINVYWNHLRNEVILIVHYNLDRNVLLWIF